MGRAVTRNPLICIVAITIILGIAAYCWFFMPSTAVHYNYSYELQDSFTTSDDETVEPSEGNQFLIIHYRMYNEGHSPAVKTSDIDSTWSISYNGTFYHVDSDLTSKYPGYHPCSISKGDKITSAVVVEVPKSAESGTITVFNNYLYVTSFFDLDESLSVRLHISLMHTG